MHDVFDLHPLGKQHKQDLIEQLEHRKVTGVHYWSTTPLEVSQPSIEANGPYDLVYVNLPYKLEQSPNTVELVITETLKLWYWAIEPGGVIVIPDYNKANIRRCVDMWVKQKKINTPVEFFIYGRQMPGWIFTLVATTTIFSGWFFIAHPSLIFVNGLPYAMTSLSVIMIPLVGAFFMKISLMLITIANKVDTISAQRRSIWKIQNETLIW